MTTTITTAQANVEVKFVSYGDVRIEYFAEGQGPLIMFLPSLGRDAEDYEVVSSFIAKQGFRILRPQPRGIGQSTGPMENITLHDLVRDITAVIENEGGGSTIVAGHAFGNWVARLAAVDRPDLVKAIAVVAASAKGVIPPHLRESIDKSSDMSLSDKERVEHLRRAFFAPGNDPIVWLKGWRSDIAAVQWKAAAATPQDEWWHAGNASILEIRAMEDPMAPKERSYEMREMFGSRVTQVEIPNASHALIPEQPEAVSAVMVAYARMLP
ncbi:alpha/beta fold hydrolase [Anaerosporomusa subterranea]|uniref:alpha/beta fold hydrolase n=1 Tax=Anaerosporomusa subterranea TaxID=1794912 RepID=UPI0009EEC6AA|nr:alpha/beta hydrolase [Anaerosporomusa subterranea]